MKSSEIQSVLVSIGLPVYNGAAYLRSALESLANQTYRDIEIIISDNSSTDDTAQICQEYCRGDGRIRYTRLAKNIGAVPNHNRIVDEARGEYFMWASSDDVWMPEYVAKCVDVLRADSNAVVVYSLVRQIDSEGVTIRDLRPSSLLDDEDPVARFRALTNIYDPMQSVYGVVRTAVLKKTPLMMSHPGSDRILFAELGLMGKLCQVGEVLYLRRIHGKQSVGAYPKLSSRYKWTNEEKRRALVFPHFEYLLCYWRAVRRSAQNSRIRRDCYKWLLKWSYWHRRELLRDLLMQS